jgi:uncharacterized protein (TIGR02246 family)
MRNGTRLSGLSLTIALAVMLAVSPVLAGDKSDMAGRAKTWEKAFNAGDTAALAAHYTEDGTRMPYQAPTISGRSAIAEQTQGTFDSGATKIKLAVLGGESQGNLAWGHGTYQLMNAEGATVQQGKWMNVSRKVDGTWLIHADIWNTDEAPE